MRILAFLGAVLATWALLCAWYYFRQEAVIFHPSRLPSDHAYSFDRRFEVHRIEVEPGVELTALLFPAAGGSPAREAVLYLHGNAGSLQDWGWHADLYVDAGHDFVVVDYRGYGTSEGEIESEAQLLADAERVWAWMTDRYPPARVSLVGYSLGAALAAHLACVTAETPPARLVLMAPFYSVRDLARRLVPFVPIRLLRYPLRTDRALAECRHELPVTIFHGAEDGTVPPSEGRRLAELAAEGPTGGPVRFVPLPGAGHQDVAEHPVFRREVRELLAGTDGRGNDR